MYVLYIYIYTCNIVLHIYTYYVYTIPVPRSLPRPRGMVRNCDGIPACGTPMVEMTSSMSVCCHDVVCTNAVMKFGLYFILWLVFSNLGLGSEIPMLLGCGQLCYISGAWREKACKFSALRISLNIPPAAYKGQPEWISTTTRQQKTTHSKPSRNHSTRRRGGWWVMTMTHDRGGG